MAALTERGRRTRERILRAALEQFSRHGFAETSVGDVLRASDTGKSQFYHYFDSKSELVREVLRLHRLERLPYRNPEHGHLDTWDRIRAWFDQLVAVTEAAGGGGLDLVGAFPEDVMEDERLAREIRRTADQRRRLLHRGLRRMEHRGELAAGADAGRIATFAAAAIEGGLHLSSTQGSAEPLRHALEETWRRLRTYARE